MHRALLQLYSRLRIPTGAGGVEPQHVAALNTEIAAFGYALSGRIIAALATLSEASFAEARQQIHALLKEESGAHVNHRILFSGFPYNTPDQHAHMFRRVLGDLKNKLRINIPDAQLLSCGHLIDPNLFDLAEFGACPICQHQVDELAQLDVAYYPYKGLTPLKVIDQADQAFLGRVANELFARPSSLSLVERQLLLSMRGHVTPAIPAQVTRETLPLVYAFHGEAGVRDLAKGATDVLRIAALLGNPEADLSLKEAPRFKLSTRDKKALLRLLDAQGNLEEDMLRHREPWLRLGERLNPGSADNRRRFPRVAAAFDTLRQAPGSVATFGRTVEKKMRARAIDQELLDTLTKRPGEFLRRIDFLLRNGGGEAVLRALPAPARGATSKMLIEVAKYLQYRKLDRPQRMFIPKGMVNKLQVVKDARAPIEHELLDRACSALAGELTRRFAALPAMGRVYIDPDLAKVVMPYNRRGDSATSNAIIKGARYPLATTDVVRLFVHWTGDIDVDLSLILFGEGLDFHQQVSWTNLKGLGCVHSGDIVSAPKGASEFIDFDIAKLRSGGNPGYRHSASRYAVASIISYRGDKFSDFPCFAGFMERDSLRSGARYEPQSVSLKMDVTAPATAHLPLVIDLKTREAIFVDVSCGNSRYARVDSQNSKQVALLGAALDLVHAKPTAYDVLIAHANARGTLVSDPAEADIRFDRDTLDIEAVMALMSDH